MPPRHKIPAYNIAERLIPYPLSQIPQEKKYILFGDIWCFRGMYRTSRSAVT
jgi:hypothetical protein